MGPKTTEGAAVDRSGHQSTTARVDREGCLMCWSHVHTFSTNLPFRGECASHSESMTTAQAVARLLSVLHRPGGICGCSSGMGATESQTNLPNAHLIRHPGTRYLFVMRFHPRTLTEGEGPYFEFKVKPLWVSWAPR